MNIKEKKYIRSDPDKIFYPLKHSNRTKPIVVDFDETLLLRNSTAEYLDSLQPRFLAAVIIKIIYILQSRSWVPNWFKNPEYQDWFLVFINTILFPWNILLWNIKARSIAQKYSNQQLIEKINNNQNAYVIVATLGYSFIVNPILKSMTVRYDDIIACRFWLGIKDRKTGKLNMLSKILQPKQITNAVVITDSLDDIPLLMKVAHPLLIIWDKAQYNPPMKNIYIPFMYLEKVKRVGEKYLLKVILGEDLAILLFAFIWQMQHQFGNLIGITLLLASFWSIYEYGYYENDLVAEKYESEPKLSETYYIKKLNINWWQPWLWSLLLSSCGILFLSIVNFASETTTISSLLDNSEFISLTFRNLALWSGYLILSRLCFWVYNYVNKRTRIWLYVVLQVSRYCGFFIIATTNIIGMSLLLGHILSRSMSYIMYRYSGGTKQDWPNKLPEQFLRWILFTCLSLSMCVAVADFSLIFSWQSLVISTWCCLKARKQIWEIISNIKLVTEDSSNNVNLEL